LNLAIIYKQIGKYAESVDVLTRGIGYNGNTAVLYYNRSCLYVYHLDDLENGLRDLIRATSLSPDLIDYMKHDKELDPIRNLKAYKLLFK